MTSMVQEPNFIQCISRKYDVILIRILEFDLRFEVCSEYGNPGRANGASPGVHNTLNGLQIFISGFPPNYLWFPRNMATQKFGGHFSGLELD